MTCASAYAVTWRVIFISMGNSTDLCPLRTVEILCDGDPGKIDETETAAEEALCARLSFWDGVLEAIEAVGAARAA